MAVNRGTEAYDLSLFEPKPAKIVELKPNKKLLKAQKKKAKIQAFLNTVATLCVAAITISVLGLMIASRVRMTELDSVINQREQRIVELQSEKTRLTDELAPQGFDKKRGGIRDQYAGDAEGRGIPDRIYQRGRRR